MGEEGGRISQELGEGNHIQNILYEKSVFRLKMKTIIMVMGKDSWEQKENLGKYILSLERAHFFLCPFLSGTKAHRVESMPCSLCS